MNNKSNTIMIILYLLIGYSMVSCVNELSDIEYELGVPIPGDVSILISASNLHQQVYTTYNEESLGLYVLYGDNELEKERLEYSFVLNSKAFSGKRIKCRKII